MNFLSRWNPTLAEHALGETGGPETHSPVVFFMLINWNFLKVHTRPRLAYALRCRGY
jgi:hypothetical protein